jgi:hypothetical protein
MSALLLSPCAMKLSSLLVTWHMASAPACNRWKPVIAHKSHAAPGGALVWALRLFGKSPNPAHPILPYALDPTRTHLRRPPGPACNTCWQSPHPPGHLVATQSAWAQDNEIARHGRTERSHRRLPTRTTRRWPSLPSCGGRQRRRCTYAGSGAPRPA